MTWAKVFLFLILFYACGAKAPAQNDLGTLPEVVEASPMCSPGRGEENRPPIPSELKDLCTDEAQLELYEKRIAPLMDGERPSSCNQCHLSGMDLSSYLRATPCQTMACLDAQELVDFTNPKESAVLHQIEMAEPTSELITEAVIQEEYDGFLEWIEYSAKCHEYVCAPYTDPCCDPKENAPVIGSTGPLGGCTEKEITDSFQSLVFRWNSRCHGCHSKCDPDYDAPCWLVEYFDEDDVNETRKAAQNSMYNLLGIGAINREEPKKSLLLLKPLAEEDGGLYHGGGEKFLGHWDASYQDFVLWLEMYSSCHKGEDYQRPVVRIMSPQTKKKIYAGDEIVLLARADDLQDDVVQADTIRWTSLGFGRQSFTGYGPFVTTMPTGKHVIRVTATDSDGNVGYRELRIRVRAPKVRPTEDTTDVVNSTDLPSTPINTPTGISAEYPNDQNIDSHPIVLWAENFESLTEDNYLDDFDAVAGLEGLGITKDSPQSELGTRALEMRAGGDFPVSTSLIKSISPPAARLYLRYYVRYPDMGTPPSGGFWLGGRVDPAEPPEQSNQTPPSGDDHFRFGIEPNKTLGSGYFDLHGRWMHMHHDSADSPENTTYPPNKLLHKSNATITDNEWHCIELMVKTNSELSSKEGAQLQFWLNNELIQDFHDDSAPGFWVGSDFCSEEADLPPCTTPSEISEEEYVPLNLQIRKSALLNLNYLWPRLDGDPEKERRMLIDNIVLAHKRIGCAVYD